MPQLQIKVSTLRRWGKNCQAVTHIPAAPLRQLDSKILSVFLRVLDTKFTNLQGNEKTIFRKAVAYLDQQLYARR